MSSHSVVSPAARVYVVEPAEINARLEGEGRGKPELPHNFTQEQPQRIVCPHWMTYFRRSF